MTNTYRHPGAGSSSRPLVSLVLPAYNEADILERNLDILAEYVDRWEGRYRCEFVIVNDGSEDATGEIAERWAAGRDDAFVCHHPGNFGLGQAFKTGFARTRGDYVVTLDVDLSYSPEHIDTMLDELRRRNAKLVLASPYMVGGRLSHVPPLRKFFSVWANRFLATVSYGRLSTLTCMVRAYDGPFVRALFLRAMGMEIMPETIYKTMIMRGRIAQVPAHLDWELQIHPQARRRSSMRILRHMMATILTGFILRPFLFFVLPGLLLLGFAGYVNSWMVVHFVESYIALGEAAETVSFSAALADAYTHYPHTFVIGLVALVLAVQLVGLGILALQNKNYFEELFYLGSSVGRRLGQQLEHFQGAPREPEPTAGTETSETKQ